MNRTDETYPDSTFCSHCKDHAVFERDEDTGEWLSVCCYAPAESVEPPLWLAEQERGA
jgi:hypothetical protein